VNIFQSDDLAGRYLPSPIHVLADKLTRNLACIPYLCMRIKRDNSGWDPIRGLPLGPADRNPLSMRPER